MVAICLVILILAGLSSLVGFCLTCREPKRYR